MTAVTLTIEQQKLVNAIDGCYLVVAPPGSGKTEVIAQRIVRLLQSGQTDDFNVLALSFTKAAASSMRQRVNERLGEVSRRVTFTTYHAFCVDILRHYGTLSGIPSDLTIYDSLEDRIEALNQGLAKSGFLESGRTLQRDIAVNLLERISRQQRSLVPVDATDEDSDRDVGFSLRDAYRAYELSLTLNGALDFDAVLVQTHRLLTEQPRVARHYRSVYKYILIDEAQDTSMAQYEILKVLCGSEHRNVFMVADPAQSIYGFSGASPRFVERFAEEFNAVRRVLSATFRSGTRIVELSSRLFVSGKKSDGIQPFQSHAVARGLVSYHEHKTEADEARAVVDWAVRLCKDGVPNNALAPKEPRQIAPEQVAILGRSRVHLKATLAELESRQIPYHFFTGDSGLFDSSEFKVVLHAFRSIANPRDVVSAKTLIAALSEFAQMDGLADDTTDEELAPEVLLPALASLVSDTSAEVPMALIAASMADVTECLEAICEWTPVSDDEALDQLLEADHELLTERWTSYKSVVDKEQRTWPGLVMEILSRPRPENAGFRVLTVHAAKGLEFRAVAIVGLNEGSFPDFRNSDGDALESEQRLAYVGVTRASRVLRLSRPQFKLTRVGQRVQAESRFINMAGLTAS